MPENNSDGPVPSEENHLAVQPGMFDAETKRSLANSWIRCCFSAVDFCECHSKCSACQLLPFQRLCGCQRPCSCQQLCGSQQPRGCQRPCRCTRDYGCQGVLVLFLYQKSDTLWELTDLDSPASESATSLLRASDSSLPSAAPGTGTGQGRLLPPVAKLTRMCNFT